MLAPCLAVGSLLVLRLLPALNTHEPWTYMSMLGEEEIYLLLSVLLYYFSRRLYEGLSLIASVILSGSFNLFLKYLLNSPRPPDPLVPVYGPGFPSGHAQVSSSFWTATYLIYRRGLVGLIAAIVVLCVSISRVYLRAHYVHDVIGGILIGVAIGVWCKTALTHRAVHGSKVYILLLQGSTLAIGVVNTFVLRVEYSATSSLLGLSAATLPVTLLPSDLLSAGFKSGLSVRAIASAACISLLVAAHYYTDSVDPTLRAVCFLCSGLLALFLPVATTRYYVRRVGSEH